MKGQISITVAIIGICGTICASLIGGWFTASSRVAEIDKKVGIVEERENNHYLEVKDKLNSIDGKLDRLLNKE